MELRVPSVEELAMMSPADVQAVAQGLEIVRRRVEAASALMVQRVDRAGAYAVDGHRRVSAWGCATNNWSGAEAAVIAKLARAMAVLPLFSEAALAGLIGVAQQHAIAKVAANPRVKEHLPGADELFTTAARDLPYDDFIVLLRHWEELADANGARSRHDRAALDRRASVSFVGERAYLDAQGPAYDGVIFDEVLAHYTNLEWQVEWDMLAAVHGDGMHAGLMERTHAQRCFDALQRIFAAAAAGANGGPAVTIDIVIDQTTFEHELERLLGGDPDPISPSHAPHRRCEDAQGRVIDPQAAVAAALVGQVRRLVLDAEGVILDVGRRQRLFTGVAREAVLLSARRCTHLGCTIPAHRCQADHIVPFSQGGETKVANARPRCGHHNRFKNQGLVTLRDAKGLWHTYRPDGTEIGWPTIRTDLEHLGSVRAYFEADHPPDG